LLERREADLVVDRLFDAFGARALRARRRRRLDFFPVLLSSPEVAAERLDLRLGALGVEARLADFLLLDRRRDVDREAERLFEALGALALRARRFRRDFFPELASESDAADFDLRLGALGVEARRDDLLLERREADLVEERRLEALGALALRRRVTARRPAERLRRLLRLGPFGVRALLAERLELRRLAERGLLARREDFRLADRFAFFAFTGVSSLRARFLIPMSLFLLASISALYASLSVQYVW